MLYILDVGFKESTLVNFESGSKTTFVDLKMSELADTINRFLSKEDELFILPDNGTAISLGIMQFMTKILHCIIIQSLVESVIWRTASIGAMEVEVIDRVDWKPVVPCRTAKGRMEAIHRFQRKPHIESDDDDVMALIGYGLILQDSMLAAFNHLAKDKHYDSSN